MASETEDRPLDAQRLAAGIRHALMHPEEARYLLASLNGEAVGALMLTFEWSDWRAGRFWWIQSVYVAPSHRRRGVYRALHERVKAMVRADPLGCGIRLYVERENGIAQATYRSLGMDETHYRLYEEDFTATD
ncbi:MAG: GNAT family N-acetyltransferase [Pseudomonadales bacterium]|nr:GNAT family N-acetyltransferase [Pseudomonadales bacterium]